GPIVRLPFSDPKSRFDRYASDVLATEDRLYVGTNDGHLLALDPKSGERVWDFASGDSVLAAPSVGKGILHFGSYDGKVYALQASTGKLLWKTDTKAPVVSTPALAGSRVIVGSRRYDLFGRDRRTGAADWKRYVWFSWIESSASVRDGVAYVGSSDAAALFAFDAQNGRSLWKTDVHGWAWGQPAVSADRVYIGTVGTGGATPPHRGLALAADRASGRPVWQFPVPAAAKGSYGFAGSPALG